MIKSDREYRSFRAFEPKTDKAEVEGQAIVYEDAELMYEDDDGYQFYEQIDRNAVDDFTDTSDVIFLYNHDGRVMARNKNGTLILSPTDAGLFIRADLSGSALGRDLVEEIRNGLTDKMSFAFTVDQEDWTGDDKKQVRHIKHIKKLYDVSAVSRPAYEATSISSRSMFETRSKDEHELREKARRDAEIEQRRQAVIERLLNGKKN